MLQSENSLAWSSLGHRLVAQIAYNHMTKESKRLCQVYNHALDKIYKPLSLVNSAAWLDSLHKPQERWLRKKHYINLPFSRDNAVLIPPDKINAISAVEEATTILLLSVDDFSKGFNLRILIHVVGDLHQPLHAASQYSLSLPRGDKGGNLVKLKANPIAPNLHSYWDKGGGFLRSKPYTNKQLKKKAEHIEKKWPCFVEKMNLDPKVWAQESHQLAVNKAYGLTKGEKPDYQYQLMVKNISEQRLAIAGCRLAALLNKIGTTQLAPKLKLNLEK
ncbi:MAG: S1/P1 nuclease [Tatlockia sp.]|nr:S1/P1 nuclease [Tatlockia sp.]